MGKGSFIIYDTDLKGILYLTDNQIGKLFRALALYRLEGTETKLGNNPALQILYQQFIEHISFNEDKYQKACRQRSEAMKKRWHEQKKTIEEGSGLYSTIEEGSGLYINDNDNDNVNVTDNVNVNVNVNDNETVTDACGAKKENKRFTYNTEKESSSYEGAPISDAELMKQRVLERYKNIMNQT